MDLTARIRRLEEIFPWSRGVEITLLTQYPPGTMMVPECPSAPHWRVEVQMPHPETVQFFWESGRIVSEDFDLDKAMEKAIEIGRCYSKHALGKKT